MLVKELMTRQVVSCGPCDTLDRAAHLMWNHDCGCLPVCAGDTVNRVVGVITDRDICMATLFQGKPLRELRVIDAMARKVRTCQPGNTLAEAEQVMRDAKIRRLPVVDVKGTLQGIIALADLAREAARERKVAKPQITEYEVGETLASICNVPDRELAA